MLAGLLALAVSAHVPKESNCCFHLTSSGGVSGPVGQLPDGQNRVGGRYPLGNYCIDQAGRITDGNGRGCFLTRQASPTFLSRPPFAPRWANATTASQLRQLNSNVILVRSPRLASPSVAMAWSPTKARVLPSSTPVRRVIWAPTTSIPDPLRAHA